MRTVYVDDYGICDTNFPIEEGEVVLVSIDDKLKFKVIGVINDTAEPCLTCPLGSAYTVGIIPRCPRLQLDDWESSDDYDLYDYLCHGISPIKVSDILEEL
jgi:hypothetical protein